MNEKFFALLRLAIGSEDAFTTQLTQEEWQTIYEMANRQGLLGVLFEVMNVLPKEMRPDEDFLLEWYGDSFQLQLYNRDINKKAVQVSEYYEKNGFKNCILKGQGNTLLYPSPFSRSPGDIDIWCSPAKDVIRFVHKNNPQGRILYHHVDAGMIDDVEIEVHYRPAFMNNLLHNSRLQHWFANHADEQFQHVVELPEGVGKIRVPTNEFNIVFQLSHVYNHLLHEGIGFRQIIDYYYLLKAYHDGRSLTSESLASVGSKHMDVVKTLRYLGLEKIGGAMMWLQHEILGLDEKYLIAPMNERLGKVLLGEILNGGNFGMYDEENIKADNQLKKNWQRIRRDIRMMRYFPSECLWEPVFRLYHFFWRLRYSL